ncbi:MAG TPA: MarR family transcriptional regulator [Steroidobacteraceae bacterium]|jgi:DNA-binding MarR family transcriptional regulator|nr:MarR family transcriptional regulator [Steroidobacteraceae bacterium]
MKFFAAFLTSQTGSKLPCRLAVFAGQGHLWGSATSSTEPSVEVRICVTSFVNNLCDGPVNVSRKPRLFHLMSLAQHRLFKFTDSTFKEALGVSHTQLGVLWMLESKPGVMLKDVSDQMGINASAITALIGRMEDAGLVRRELSDEDGRVAHIFATKEGLAKAVAARPILSQLNSRLLADFSDREIAAVARFLNTILERF